MRGELDYRVMGDDLVDRNFRGRRVKSFACAEGWDRDMQALGIDLVHTFGEQSQVAAANREFFDGNQWSRRCRIVIESKSLDNASGKRKISPVKSASLNLTLAGRTQVL